MKKFASLFLALVLLCTLSLPTFAVESGSVTLYDVSEDTEYHLYRLLDLVTYDENIGISSYKVNSDWTGYFDSAEAKEYIAIDEAGYVTWVAGDSDTIVAAFAQKALAYAEVYGIAPIKSSEIDGDFVVTGNSGVFSNLPLGWYLVDSNVGALCGLTTIDPNASVNAKNSIPTIDLCVQEDLTDEWGDANTADVDQIVNYMSIIHVAAGAENYVLHDAMSEGLTFVHDLADGRGVTEIKWINSQGVEATLTEGVDYTVKAAGFDDDCTFEVAFSDSLIASLHANDRLIIYYNAMLNRYAEVGSTEGNPNESWLEYGEEHFTFHDQTKTYTFEFDIVTTDASNQLLKGAEYRIYDAPVGGNEIAVTILTGDYGKMMLDEYDNPVYCRADISNSDSIIAGGVVTVVGIDNGTYYLEQVKAPAGYNMLTARKEFTIADANLDSVFNDGIYSTGSGVQVINKIMELPDINSVDDVLPTQTATESVETSEDSHALLIIILCVVGLVIVGLVVFLVIYSKKKAQKSM